MNLRKEVNGIVRKAILRAYKENNYNLNRTAQSLEIPRSTLIDYMEKLRGRGVQIPRAPRGRPVRND